MTDYDYIWGSLASLERFIRENQYSGFDPYDALNSEVLNPIPSRYVKLFVTQFFVYSPINLRNFFKIVPEKNPKAIGLFLQSYCKLFRKNLIGSEDFEKLTTNMVDFLNKNKSIGYSGDCWGFNFNWQDIKRYSKKGMPTIVITSFVANAFLDLYELTKNENYLAVARSSCNFIINDLFITKTKDGICFSYTPIDKYCVHNANALGAALLARVYSITKEEILKEYSTKAFDFLLSNQKNDGSWSYSLDIASQKERNQIDFHQGFILDSIQDYILYIAPSNDFLKKSLKLGANFFIEQQFDCYGRSKWRFPLKWPIDIHNQAQGIITCSKLSRTFDDDKYFKISNTIARWTIKNMQDRDGYFYYQKWPLLTNQMCYMRWGQAWMFLALSILSNYGKNPKPLRLFFKSKSHQYEN